MRQMLKAVRRKKGSSESTKARDRVYRGKAGGVVWEREGET